MAYKSGAKELKRNWPVVSGLAANQKHEGRQMNLVPEEKSLVNERDKVGIR